MITPPFARNELSAGFLGASGLNPWPAHDSSSRIQMFNSHLGQALVIEGATTRRCLTGLEAEFGKYTFSIKMPTDAQIIRSVLKYPPVLGAGGIKENPLTVVIYEDVENKEVGIVNLVRHHVNHQHFGFKYSYKAAQQKLSNGSYIAKGTIIADSPSVDELGNYRYGIETNVAFMSVPAVIEDGVVVSRSYLKKLTAKDYESRLVSFGKNRYPLNLYGDENNYKPMPDIGDRIRADGLVFALRSYDDLLAVVDMTPAALMVPDYAHDKLIYGEPNARVVDINVHHDKSSNNPPTPTGMEVQCARYEQAMTNFYRTLLDEYHKLRRTRGAALRLTPEFHRLLVEAMADSGVSDSGSSPSGSVKRTYRRAPLDDWRVELTYEFDFVPCIGSKITDCHGGKGIICDVREDEDMPIDQWGNRADIIMDGDSRIKRMNLGGFYEPYINAASREQSETVRKIYGLEPKGRYSEKDLRALVNADVQAGGQKLTAAFEHVMGYYSIVSPKMYQGIVDAGAAFSNSSHILRVLSEGIYLYMPSDNPVESIELIKALEAGRYKVPIGPVKYRGKSGREVTTKANILIGSVYIMLLEKTGGDWSGVASAKLQVFGIPAKLTNADKYSAPGRGNPVRLLAEDEVRLFVAAVGSDVTADLLDQSNNPKTHKEIYRNVVKAAQPTNIPCVIDREVHKRGNSRTLVFIRHMMECSGVKFVNKPYVSGQ